MKAQLGGAETARLIAVRYDDPSNGERCWRLATSADCEAATAAARELEKRKTAHRGPLSLVPDENLPPDGTLGFRVQKYGVTRWGQLFTPRQALVLTTLSRLVREASAETAGELGVAVRTCLSLAVDRMADFNASLCVLNSVGGRGVVHVFGRQALPMVWDFLETNPFNSEAANWRTCIDVVDQVVYAERNQHSEGLVAAASATSHALPNETASAFITDPPYYDAVPYADLSEFFYVWLRRTLVHDHASLLSSTHIVRDEECIVNPVAEKDSLFYQEMMFRAMVEGRRILRPDGIGIIVFAHKSTAGWETQLQAMVDAGWTITGSWPIDTERPGRLRAQNSAALASSVHLVCRPREAPNDSVQHDNVGDWRDVLDELPRRLHDWMPRLTAEGVVGADAIFACLGPALEIFSHYSRVEKASGELVTLKEYLEYVWAAVAREALSVIFAGADASGLEPDARITAIWLWTLTGEASPAESDSSSEEDNSDDSEDAPKAVAKGGAFTLEFDTARKIAQGLGANLDVLRQVVEVKGETARLLRVAERARYLLGKDAGQAPKGKREKAGAKQLTLFEVMTQIDEGTPWGGELSVPPPGATVLDRVHQSMILFGGGRAEALKRFLVEEGAGNDARLWKLAQSLSALYPSGTDEKRWVDGVLARKKGLGF